MDRILDLGLWIAAVSATTVPLTALVCWFRSARGKRNSYGTLLSCAFAAGLLVFLAASVYLDGKAVFTLEYWTTADHKMPPIFNLVIVAYFTLMAILPTLGVILFYQRKKKRSVA